MPADRPEISVLMNFRGRGRLMAQAIRSVLSQSFSDFELLLFDDGQPGDPADDASDVARVFEREDARVRVVREHGPGIGRASAAMACLERSARGEFIGWVDSDDLLVQTALEETRRVLRERPEAGFVYTQHLEIDADNRPGGIGRRCLVPFDLDRLLVDFMAFHFRLYRRSVSEAIDGIDARFLAAADYDFVLRMSERAPVLHLASPLYCYRVHGESISGGRSVVQIGESIRAVENAMKRRGIWSTRELRVRVESHLRIVPRAEVRS
jgi:glycosyltransferase involved in cell wall biosynthesis